MPFISGGAKVLGVFGWPVEHSLSPAMHNAAISAINLPYVYVPFAVPPTELKGAIEGLKSLGIVGVNLTIPHKEAVITMCDEISDNAREVGAVNTLHLVDGRVLGDNTDGRGFYEPLLAMGYELKGKQAFVLGAGGAARSVVFQLLREGARVAICNRSPERAERLAKAAIDAGYDPERISVVKMATSAVRDCIAESSLFVQTAKIGMHPNIDELPQIPLDALHANLLVYDLVYNPLETRLLAEAKLRGCPTLDGLQMLVYQGAVAFHKWTGVFPPTDVMERAALDALKSR